MSRNAAALRRVADQIEAEPRRYDQEVYADRSPCGSVHCVAGWACVHGGATLVWNAEFEGYGFAVLGVPVHPEDMGAAALGLTSDEGRVLFNQAWAPASGLTVPDALRRLADGASLLGVSSDRVRTACSMYPDHRMVEEYHAELAAHA